jgi:crotonobetainyl-CoA:carnitine CoA-transferase CaiB-like acyl-CoA transferase
LFGKTKQETDGALRALGLPFAPIMRPKICSTIRISTRRAGLRRSRCPTARRRAKLPILPLEMNGQRLGTRLDLPRVGEHTRELLEELGYGGEEIDRLVRARVVAA